MKSSVFRIKYIYFYLYKRDIQSTNIHIRRSTKLRLLTMTSSKSYESQEAWKKIQQFLPSRPHFIPEHAPVEEWWQSHGHTIHLDRWRNPDAKARVILRHGVGSNGRQMSMILGVPLHAAGFELVAIDTPGYGCSTANGVYSYDD